MQADQSHRIEAPADEWANGDAIDLKAWLRDLWAGRWWLVGGVLVAAVAATVLAFMTVPIYRATALLAPASLDRNNMSGVLGSALGQLGGLASLAGINVNTGDAETQEALAVLRSRRFSETFIKDKNLIPRFFARRWDAAAERWKGSEDDWPTPARAYKYFDRKVRSIVQDKKTGLISLQIDWRNRAEAASWANELVQRLNAEMRARAISKAGASIGYLQKELALTQDIGTREAINRLIEAQIKQRMLANVTEEYAFRVVDPALAPDPKDMLKPQKVLTIVIGSLLGGLLAAVAVLLFRRRV